MLIQSIKQAVAEAPEKEEDGDERNGPYGFPESEFGCSSHMVVGDLQRSFFEELLGAHDCL